MCIEFQYLSCQAAVIKSLACLLTNFIAVVFLENSENDSKFKDWINFGIYWKICFHILGLSLGSVALDLVLHVSDLCFDLGLLALALALIHLASLTSLQMI